MISNVNGCHQPLVAYLTKLAGAVKFNDCQLAALQRRQAAQNRSAEQATYVGRPLPASSYGAVVVARACEFGVVGARDVEFVCLLGCV